MKKLVLLMMVTFGFSAVATAAGVGPMCALNAAAFVANFAEPGYYDQDGFDAYNCAAATNGKVVVCDVAALKGDGAAADTFQIVMSGMCSKVLRIELIGEE